jgi:hypothetical protein
MTLAEKILQMKEKRANLTTQIRGILDDHEGKDYAQEKLEERNKLEKKQKEELKVKYKKDKEEHERKEFERLKKKFGDK